MTLAFLVILAVFKQPPCSLSVQAMLLRLGTTLLVRSAEKTIEASPGLGPILVGS
jgi:hypothetical protein